VQEYQGERHTVVITGEGLAPMAAGGYSPSKCYVERPNNLGRGSVSQSSVELWAPLLMGANLAMYLIKVSKNNALWTKYESSSGTIPTFGGVRQSSVK
jgi:uncharacterized protein YgiB involved in biofilm formation